MVLFVLFSCLGVCLLVVWLLGFRVLLVIRVCGVV